MYRYGISYSAHGKKLMATENNWLQTNIRNRLINPKSTFVVYINHRDYEKISFDEASNRVVEKIINKHDNIYVPLSGGMDSEYVFNCFLGHKFTPIIVNTPANKLESTYAFRKCKDTGIQPIVIEKSEKEMVKIYYDEIYKKIRGKGYNSTASYIAGKYADEHNGVAIIGEHGYDGLNEWDFYNDALIHENNSIYFFMYDPEIFSAMIDAYELGEDHQIFKAKLYGIPLRQKMKYTYSEDSYKIIQQLVETLR